MPKGEFLMTCHTFDPKKHPIAGRFASEKLDGQRVFWDGGVSRGLEKAVVPWANCDRDSRYKKIQMATGLWTRYGNVIHAPDFFLDGLPKMLLDGELYAGRGKFQKLRSIVADLEPSVSEWQDVQLLAFDSPPPQVVFADRDINITNYKKKLVGCYGWWKRRGPDLLEIPANEGFSGRLSFLRKWFSVMYVPVVWKVHEQRQLPLQNLQAMAEVEEWLDEIVCNGGEGLILKSRESLYETNRSYAQLKVKPSNDAEAKVVGYVWGALPDNTRTVSGEAGGKLLGKMGALLCAMPDGKRFKLSGFTDAEREMSWSGPSACGGDLLAYGTANAGQTVDPLYAINLNFPIDSVITYKYRELTDDGYPKEPRYFRKPLVEA